MEVHDPEKVVVDSHPALQDDPQISLKRRLYWVLLAFIPSSLLFGVTTYITTEIAPTPLLWTIPLALYLVTFILAFARRNFASERLANSALGGLGSATHFGARGKRNSTDRGHRAITSRFLLRYRAALSSQVGQ